MLQYIDEKGGLAPFHLLDGHQSRFELDFLKYVNSEEASG
jgi:hypothetical protein